MLGEKINLDDNLSVELNYVENGKIYGDVLDTSLNGELFSTRELFEYDYKNNEYFSYSFPRDKRIWDYYIIDDVIYISVIEEKSDNSGYYWYVYRCDTSFESEKLLASGFVVNPMFSPIFIHCDNCEGPYIITIEDYIDENSNTQKYSIYEINEKGLSIFKSEVGDLNKRTGHFLCSVDSIIISNNDITYCVLEDYQKQYLISIDLDKTKERKVFETSLDNWIISSDILRKDDRLFVLSYSSASNYRNKISLVDIKEESYMELETGKLGFANFIFDSQYILFHSMEQWKIYSTVTNSVFDVSFPNMYAYPKYLILEKDKILFENDKAEFFIGSIKKEE